jgi:hypothetical protein
MAAQGNRVTITVQHYWFGMIEISKLKRRIVSQTVSSADLRRAVRLAEHGTLMDFYTSRVMINASCMFFRFRFAALLVRM